MTDSDNYNLIDTPNYVYMIIPTEYIKVYHILMLYISKLGKNILDDCSATCKTDGKNIISCWALFQSAVSAYNLGDTKKSDLFIDYIKKQLKILYGGEDIDTSKGTTEVFIDEAGMCKALVTYNSEDCKFYINDETKELYQEYEKEVNVFNISNNNLTINEQT